MNEQRTEGQGRLVKEVINRGLCVGCGACVGLCPYFQYFNGKVVVMDRCEADTSRCLQLCPRADSEETSPEGRGADSAESGEIGPCRDIFTARTADPEIKKRAQYGGVVSTLLINALEKGIIRGAVLTDAGGSFSPGGKMARDPGEVLLCAGSRYSASGGLSALNLAIRDGEERLAVVGLPCQMEALERMGLMKPDGQERSQRVSLRLGLFCTWALDYRRLEGFLTKHGLSGPIKKFDIPPPPADKFQVLTDKEWTEFPLSEVRGLVQKGCALCQDMTAEWADLSVGTVEGMEDWNTVVVRTEAGERFMDGVIRDGRLEKRPIAGENLEHLKEASLNKRKRGARAREDLKESAE